MLNGDGTITFTPAAGFSGTAGFDYTVSDGNLSDIGHVAIDVTAVNHAPVCANQGGTTNEDTALNSTVVCSDADATSLTYSVLSGVTNGSLIFSPNGSFTYTPTPNYSGPDSFTFKANDGSAGSNEATYSITVAPVNDAPVANPQSVTTQQNTAVAITLTGIRRGRWQR